MTSSPSACPQLLLRLYVAGESPNSAHARRNLAEVCKAYALSERIELEIVDVLDDPLRMLSDAISVTPMLLRLAPSPVVRLVGDLSDRGLLLEVLGLP